MIWEKTKDGFEKSEYFKPKAIKAVDTGYKRGVRGEDDYGDDNLGKTVLIDYPLYVTQQLNENFMGLIIGMPGKGKTWAAVRLAEQVDPTFDITRVCVSYKEFLEVMKTLTKEYEETGSVAGKVVVFDEFQQSASARKWHSAVNNAINDVLHTFRFMNLIVIFTTPHLSFIDINARAVMHFQITMKKKIPSRGISHAELKFSAIKNDPWNPSDKLWHYAPRVFDAGGSIKVNEIYFEKPSVKMQHAIDYKINTFKMSVLDKAIQKADDEMVAANTEQKTAAQITREFADDIFKNKARYVDPQNNKWDRGAIMLDYPELTKSKYDTIRALLDAKLKRELK